MDEDQLLKLRQVAGVVQQSLPSVRKLIASGALPAIRLGVPGQRRKVLRVRASALAAFLAQREGVA